MKKERMFPGHPPEDYTGTVAEWVVKLQEYGLWDGVSPEWYGDLEIPESVYARILEECEEG